MIRNLVIYLCILFGAFTFNVFYYAWFSWFLLLTVLTIPAVSLLASLPFMIIGASAGINIFANKTVNAGSDYYIGVSGKKRGSVFCPLLELKIKAENKTSGRKSRIKFRFSGTFLKPVIKKESALSKHCGIISLRCGYAKFYDMLGIFFIPVKVGSTVLIKVMPKPTKPNILPDKSMITVMGYKPKPTGLGDDYELREYRNGDSIRSIHWKLSSKYDEPIVKEPVVPVVKAFLICPQITDNAESNDKVFAKLLYVCRYMIKSFGICYAESKNKSICKLKSEQDIMLYFESIYLGIPFPQTDIDSLCVQNYNIFSDSEEVQKQ